MDGKKLLELRAASEIVYSGPVFDLYRDRVLLPNGCVTGRDYIKSREAAAVVAVDGGGNVILERQFRYPHGKALMEIPAGKLESSDADPLEAAKRELHEETGITAGRYVSLGTYIPSPAMLSEVIHVFLASELSAGEPCPDRDEILETLKMPLRDAVGLIMENRISDGKTVFGILKAWLRLGGEKDG